MQLGDSEMSEERINRLDGKVSLLETQSAKMQASISSLVSVIDDQGKIQNRILEKINALTVDSTQVSAVKGMVAWKSIISLASLFLSLIAIGVTMLTLVSRDIVEETDLKISHQDKIRKMQNGYEREIRKIKNEQLKRQFDNVFGLPHIGCHKDL